MQERIYNEDKGVNFGKWNDQVSRLMYYDSIKDLFENIDTNKSIADYGGANGILKEHYPSITTIDIDSSKNPDIVADILTYEGKYDIIILRYVLHYLNDYEVLKLFQHIASYHSGKVYVQQFVNNDLKNKYANSKNEFKYFRTEQQLNALLPTQAKPVKEREYIVDAKFYKNRLGIDNAVPHTEKIITYEINY